MGQHHSVGHRNQGGSREAALSGPLPTRGGLTFPFDGLLRWLGLHHNPGPALGQGGVQQGTPSPQ